MEVDSIDLTESPWKLLDVDTSMQWLFKFHCEKASYQIALCNLSSVFFEKMNSENIQQRCSIINKRLEAPSENIVNHVKQSLSQHYLVKFSCTTQNDSEVHLSFSSHFKSGIPFCWTFKCMLKNDKSESATKKLLLDPLILTLSRMLCENKKLKEVIKQKDEEIKDYRDSGYKLSRSHLKTNLFDVQMFENDLKLSRDYAASITKDSLKVISSNEVNNLITSTSTDSSSPAILSHLQAVSTKESVSLSKSPTKKQVFRKPRPAVRGCVLNADIDNANTVSDIQNFVEESSSVSVPKKKPKKFVKKVLF